MLYANWQGINNVDPVHTMLPGELTIAQNVLCKAKKLEKIPGSDEYMTGLPGSVPWCERYYGIKPDGTEVKYSFAFSEGKVYSKNEPLNTVTERLSGLDENSVPESVLTRSGGNNILFLFTGQTPYEYNGNDSLTWKKSIIEHDFIQGVWWLDKLWAFEDNTSTLWYSKTTDPSNFTDSTDAGFLSIAASDGGKIISIMLIGDILYIFKDTGIFYIEGRVPSRFVVRTVFDDRGLATKRGIVFTNTTIVLLCEQDKEWYAFNGTETGWKKLSEKLNFANLVNTSRMDLVSAIWHDDIFRCSYPDIRDGGYQANREIIHPTDEQREDGQPKWSETKGANIASYAILDRQDDNNILITGRSDTGKTMRHGRIYHDIASMNWDELEMEVIVRTSDQLEQVGVNHEFIDANLSGGVHDGTIETRYYLDSRNETRSSTTIDQDGEDSASAFGQALGVPQQVRYNDYFTFAMGYNIGVTMALEFYDKNLDTHFELYEVNVQTRPLHRKRGKGIGA